MITPAARRCTARRTRSETSIEAALRAWLLAKPGDHATLEKAFKQAYDQMVIWAEQIVRRGGYPELWDQETDLVHQLLLTLPRTVADNFDPTRSLTPFVFCALRNTYRDYARHLQAHRERTGVKGSVINRDDPTCCTEHPHSVPSISCVLAVLERRDAEIMQLRYVDGLSAAAVAHKLDLTVAAVNLRAYRARRVLRKHFTLLLA